MKKLFFAMALTLCAATATAQVAAVAEKPMPKKRAWAGYETNRFRDNWELGVAGGVQFVGIHGVFGKNDPGKKLHHVNWQGAINLTKWVHPVVGARLQIQGGQYQAQTASLRYLKDPYVFAHIDAMINLSNWIGKYRGDRRYYAILFGGMGFHTQGFTKPYHKAWNEHTNKGFAATAGLLNKFRITKGLDLELELKTWTLASRDMPRAIASNDRATVGYSATLGLAYRFKHRGWKQASPYTYDDIVIYQKAVADRDQALAAADANSKKLARDLAAAKKALEEVKTRPASGEGILLGEQSVSFFRIGSSKLNLDDTNRLDIIAAELKRAPKGRVYVIEGHADAQTGTTTINQKLSEERAKNVYNYLIGKGVNPKILTYKGMGDRQAPFASAAENRNVLIK